MEEKEKNPRKILKRLLLHHKYFTIHINLIANYEHRKHPEGKG
jgi:hypothetical protein